MSRTVSALTAPVTPSGARWTGTVGCLGRDHRMHLAISRLYHFDCALRASTCDRMNQIVSCVGVPRRCIFHIAKKLSGRFHRRTGFFPPNYVMQNRWTSTRVIYSRWARTSV